MEEGWPVRLTGKPATEGIGEVAAAKWRSRAGRVKTKERKKGGKGG